MLKRFKRWLCRDTHRHNERLVAEVKRLRKENGTMLLLIRCLRDCNADLDRRLLEREVGT